MGNAHPRFHTEGRDRRRCHLLHCPNHNAQTGLIPGSVNAKGGSFAGSAIEEERDEHRSAKRGFSEPIIQDRERYKCGWKNPKSEIRLDWEYR
jgi:hypothetical protein